MAEFTDERQLVLRAQCGDREALETLLLGLEDRLSRFVRGLVGDPAADDILQEVFVKIWRSLNSLHRPELLRPWAYRIAARTSFDYLKRRRLWSDRHDPAAAIEDLPDLTPSGTPELIAGMDALLEKLPPSSRAVLLLHYRHDLPIDDVAAVLNISAGTAKSRLAYGLACLRKYVIQGEPHAARTVRTAPQSAQ